MKKIYKKTCKCCGKVFKTDNNSTQYCEDCHHIKVKCAGCGKEFELKQHQLVKFWKNKYTINYCCSKKCLWLATSVTKKREETTKRLYGVNNVSQSSFIKNKKKQTTRKNYGVDNPSQSETVKKRKEETNMKNRGVKYPTQSLAVTRLQQSNYKKKTGYNNPSQNPEVKKAKIQNYRKKTGYDHPSQNPVIRKKFKQTMQDTYGVDHPMKVPAFKKKAEETCMENYGVPWILADKEARKKALKKYKKRTGYDYPSQNPDVQRKAKEKYKSKTGYDNPSQNPDVWAKKFKNMKESNKYNSTEKKITKILQKLGMKKNRDFFTEYKDDKYPFFCDLYIPSKRLYVEFNLYWTHCFHWYNGRSKIDRDRRKELEKLAEKSKFYKDALKVWTERDIEKRKIAAKNNLNYVVLWNWDEINEWIDMGLPIRKDWKNS